jgi:L-threonylcarbamoyladenylate synthase
MVMTVAVMFASGRKERLYLAPQPQREPDVTSRLSVAEIEQAAALLRAGRLVAFPTETVYGLGGDATNDEAVAAIFAAKGRPRFNPLIVHLLKGEQAERLAIVDGRALRLMQRFWPGPLSLVLRRAPHCPISLLASAGLDTMALRVPSHPVAQELLRVARLPIAAPSANRSGRVSPTNADHVMIELQGRIAAVLDGGTCPVGIESTVLDLSAGRATLLRPGAVTQEEIEAEIGPIETSTHDETAPRSPGMMASHYAPSLPLRLEAKEVSPGEALLAFGGAVPEGAAETLNLSAKSDLAEAAAHLFAMLRALDRADFTGIAVMPIPERGLGRAINDRLKRAAHR